MIISLNDIVKQYGWIANSSLYKELTEEIEIEGMNIELDYPIYFIGMSINQLFYVINYWGIYEIPFEILDEIEKTDHCYITEVLLEMITDLSLKTFSKKFLYFITALNNKETFCENIAKYEYLDMLKWGIIYKNFGVKQSFKQAAKYGHIDILNWLHKNNLAISYNVIYEAVISNQYESVVWLFDRNFEVENDIIENVIYTNNIKLMNYVYEKIVKDGKTIDFPHYKINNSTKIETLEWLYRKEMHPTDDDLSICAELERLDLMEWCYEKGLRGNGETYKCAVCQEKLNSVKLLYDRDVELYDELLNYALINNNLEIADYLYDKGCRFNNNTNQIFQDEYIELETLKWMYEHKFEFGENVFGGAISHGNIEAMEWLINNNFPIDTSDAIYNAFRVGDNINVLNCLYENGFQFESKDYNTAIYFEHMDAMEFLYEHGIKPESQIYLDMCVQDGVVEYFEWLYNHGCEIPYDLIYIDDLSKNIKKWILSKK